MELMNTWQDLLSIGLIGLGFATFFQTTEDNSEETEKNNLSDKNSILEENQHLKLIFSNAQKYAKIGTWEWNPKTGNIIWSDEMFKIFETDRCTTPTMSLVKSMISEKDLYDYELSIKKILNGSVSKKTKYRIRTSNGKAKCISVRAGISSKDGAVVILGTVQDVTKQTQITNFLSKAKNNYKLLTETLPVGIYRTNTKGELLFVNQTMVEMFGFENMSEMKRYNCSDFYHHKNDRLVMIDNLTAKGMLQDYRILCKRKDGSTFVVTENSQFQNNEIHGVLQDVTTRSKMENEKNTLISTLKRQNKDYETFAHIISHNLRVPLVNIMGLTEIFDTDSMKKDNMEILDLMKQSTTNLDMIIKDLNKTISIREKRHDHYKIISMSKILKSVKEELSDQINEADIIISSNITHKDCIFSIPEFIQNIFLQILDNSIKFRSLERPCKINIEFEQTSSSNILSFEDNGIGIDMVQNNNRLFKLYEKFYSDIDGRGVGLYMTYNQVNALNGNISLNSKVDVGTKVIITLPNAES